MQCVAEPVSTVYCFPERFSRAFPAGAWNLRIRGKSAVRVAKKYGKLNDAGIPISYKLLAAYVARLQHESPQADRNTTIPSAA